MSEKMSKDSIECKLRLALKIIYDADFEENIAFSVFRKRNITTPRNMGFFGMQTLVREYMLLISDVLSCDYDVILYLAQNYAICMDIDGVLTKEFENDLLLAVDVISRCKNEYDDFE